MNVASAVSARQDLAARVVDDAKRLGITALSGAKLAGDSTDWIVETPIVNGVLTQMPDCGKVFFPTCEAALTNGTVFDGGTGNNINLAQGSKTISTGALVTPSRPDNTYAA